MDYQLPSLPTGNDGFMRIILSRARQGHKMGFADAQQAVYFLSGYWSSCWCRCYGGAPTVAGKPQVFAIVHRKCKKPSQIRYTFMRTSSWGFKEENLFFRNIIRPSRILYTYLLILYVHKGR
ncbi:uncharacterized protein LOC112464440 [Temnothorax curvispinosus]|uniref:Uncharacterized protein LOC112464440 n=1 Tax=Temnothorax curvispinosus TaxID=300111 RepID=A0A6J1QXX8_9HYME|nr:uncharacterized protein LOC112464440 [Temnothorax curvispinosus]